MGQLEMVHTKDLRQCRLDFRKFERLIVNKADAIETDVEAFGDGLYGSRLGSPVDLRIEEVFFHIEFTQPGERRLCMIAAGDGVQNAASIKRVDDFLNAVAQMQLVSLKQSPVP